MFVGDNGVLTQAQKAKIKTDKASAQEKIEMEVAGSYDDKGNLDLTLLNDNLYRNLKGLQLKKKGAVGDKEDDFEDFDNNEVKIKSLPATVYYKQTEVKIKELISNVAKNYENYGKYVDYPIDINGDGRTEKDWMIFYEDDEGNVFLKASDYVVAGGDNKCKELVESMEKAGMTNSTNSVYSAKWGVPPDEKAIYDDKCKLNSSLFKYNYCNNGLGCNLEKNNNPNAKCVKTLLNPTNWESFVSGNANKYGRCAIGSPTLDMWINSWNQHSDKENYPVLYCNSSNNNGYCIVKDQL